MLPAKIRGQGEAEHSSLTSDHENKGVGFVPRRNGNGTHKRRLEHAKMRYAVGGGDPRGKPQPEGLQAGRGRARSPAVRQKSKRNNDNGAQTH